jgi:hypothetical protein
MLDLWLEKHVCLQRDRQFFKLLLSQGDFIGAVLDVYTSSFDGEAGVTLFYQNKEVDYLNDADWDEVKITHPALVELLNLLGFNTQWSSFYRKGQKPCK